MMNSLIFDVVKKEDLGLEQIRANISRLQDENTADYRQEIGYLLDFYEGRMGKPEYLKNFGFDDVKLPLMTIKLTEKVINKISLLYKVTPKREITADDDYNDLITDNETFNIALRTAERYKKLLGAVLFMSLYTNSGWRNYIFTEWLPWFSKADALTPIAYSIPLVSDVTSGAKNKDKEEVWLFVSDQHWFLHDANGGNVKPDPAIQTDADGTSLENPIGLSPIVEMRSKFPVTGYWPQGQVELASANQSLNIGVNDLYGIIHYQLFPEKLLKGVRLEEVGIQKGTTGALIGTSLKSGFNKIHVTENQDADMSVTTPSPELDQAINAIQKILAMVGEAYGVNIKLETKGSPPSGFSLLVENIDLLEARQDDIEPAELTERQIYKAFRAQNDHFKDLNYKLPELEGDTKLIIDYTEGIKFPVNYTEEIALWEFKFKNNLASILDWYKSQDTELSDDEIMDKIEKTKKINLEQTPLQASFQAALEEPAGEE